MKACCEDKKNGNLEKIYFFQGIFHKIFKMQKISKPFAAA